MDRLLRRRTRLAGCLAAAVAVTAALATGPAAQAKPGGSRVDRLISRMTLDEKLTLVSGAHEGPTTTGASTVEYQAGYLPGIPRLGIPSLRLSDGPPGVSTKRLSTGMTQTMAVAATFSRDDARSNGTVIGQDARALGQDVVLEPFINMHRDPAWSRAWNTFGEDPLLTGAMGAEEIQGIQDQGIMAQAKHYVAYDGASGNTVVDDQTLHEVYLKPFADAVAAGVSSIMCSYNKINGTQSCGDDDTLNTILKGELGFTGFVTSDWGASHATDFINKGLDLEMPGAGTYGDAIPAYLSKDKLKAAVDNGTVKVSTIDDAVRRILGQYDRFGLLDGRQKHTVTPEPVAADERVVKRTAEDAAVLLKNDKGALPLTGADLSSLAMIGPGAGQTMATGGGGEKATGRADRWIGTVQAVRHAAPTAKVAYAVGDDMTGRPIPPGALSHNGSPGLLRTDTGTGATSVDATLDLTKANGKALPAGSAHTWTGTLSAPESGTYWINFGELGTTGSVSIDGKQVIAGDGFITPTPRFGTVKAGDAGVLPSTDGLNNKRAQVGLTKGEHTLSVTQTPDVSGDPVQVHLYWVPPSQQKDDQEAAVRAAAKARTAVVFAWSTGTLGSPLPEGQDKLISDIAAVNKNTIVVLNTNEPLAMPWLGGVRAVLNMWFPGDEGGWATADLLLGRVNPAGRLPITWPKSLDQGVANDPAHPERSSNGVNPGTTAPCTATSTFPEVPNCDTEYSEGIDIGYRWFDRQRLTPLFPFGYGLSYTGFAYSGLSVQQQKGGGLRVAVTVTNTGGRGGDEVPQVYLGPPNRPPAGVQFAPSALSAFGRIHLGPGQSRRVVLDVNPRELSYWDSRAHRWTLATGTRTVSVGTSSRDPRLRTTVTITG